MTCSIDKWQKHSTEKPMSYHKDDQRLITLKELLLSSSGLIWAGMSILASMKVGQIRH